MYCNMPAIPCLNAQARCPACFPSRTLPRRCITFPSRVCPVPRALSCPSMSFSAPSIRLSTACSTLRTVFYGSKEHFFLRRCRLPALRLLPKPTHRLTTRSSIGCSRRQKSAVLRSKTLSPEPRSRCKVWVQIEVCQPWRRPSRCFYKLTRASVLLQTTARCCQRKTLQLRSGVGKLSTTSKTARLVS